jgi:uncharacterized protein (TIGR03437 family)
VEGREFNSPSSIAFDTFSSPPILYVADTGNNRVLAWKNPQGLAKGNPADLVIGQLNMYSTLSLGPGTNQPNGLKLPTSVAVDNLSNLYVLDAGNNRIVRFPAPLRQSGGSFLQWDLVIGQTSINSGGSPNQGLSAPTAATLAFQVGNNTLQSALAFDSLYNLWVTDSGNNRVLQFPQAVLTPNAVAPQAAIVLGQGNSNCVGTNVFACNGNPPPAPNNGNPQLVLTGMYQPSGVTVDSRGDVLVTDALARVLYFQGPITTSTEYAGANQVLGVPPPPAQGQRALPVPNNYSLGFNNVAPAAVFTDGSNIYVCDTGAHRIVDYGPPQSWAAPTAAKPSPPILSAVPIGQPDLNSGKPNKGQPSPDGTTLQSPIAGAFPFGPSGDMWVADTGNNRILDLPQVGPQSFGAALRVVGQLDFIYNAPNLIEGREVYLAANAPGGGIVVDQYANPPHLYVADTFNNRILGFRDARSVGTDARSVLTQKADLVIGEPDLYTAVPNYPTGNLNATVTPNASGLNQPVGLVVDAGGNLYVADEGNSRVVRFPAPFNQPPAVSPQANLVLGQNGFTATPIGLTGPANMGQPYGLAMLSDGSLAVSDRQFNRVLVFQKQGIDFTNHQAASIVIGQGNFNDSQPLPLTTANYGLRSPAHLAVDSSDRLYVADTGNSRVAIFTQVLTAAPGGFFAASVPGLSSPLGVTVNAATGETWIADTAANVVARYPEFTQLQFDQTATAQLASATPMVLALDSFGNLIVGEAANRITFYFAELTYQHAATYNQRPLAPGQLAYLYQLGVPFSFTPADGTQISPWPYTLGDVQVTVNGTMAPIFRVNPTRIDFQVPQSAPTSGSAVFVVSHPSTGQIVATASIQMAPTNPGFFTSNTQGFGQVAAFNQDGSVNSPSNPIARGSVISFCLTGAGPVPNAPPDGAPPAAAAPTPVQPVLFSSAFPSAVPGQYLQYSGLGCGFAGGWQVNFQVPTEVPPGPSNAIGLTYQDVASNVGATTTPLVVLFSAK